MHPESAEQPNSMIKNAMEEEARSLTMKHVQEF